MRPGTQSTLDFAMSEFFFLGEKKVYTSIYQSSFFPSLPPIPPTDCIGRLTGRVTRQLQRLMLVVPPPKLD